MTLGGAAAAAAAESKPGKAAEDLATIAGSGSAAIRWGWYQEGYVNSRAGDSAQPGNVAHHNAPQYFDYLRNNSVYWSHVPPVNFESAFGTPTLASLPDEASVEAYGARHGLTAISVQSP